MPSNKGVSCKQAEVNPLPKIQSCCLWKLYVCMKTIEDNKKGFQDGKSRRHT